MSFVENWLNAFNARDKDALTELIHDDFVFVRHQSKSNIEKEEMVNIWSKEGPRPVRRAFRIIYENDDVAITHQYMDFPSGSTESVMMVMLLTDGKVFRMETGATPMSS